MQLLFIYVMCHVFLFNLTYCRLRSFQLTLSLPVVVASDPRRLHDGRAEQPLAPLLLLLPPRLRLLPPALGAPAPGIAQRQRRHRQHHQQDQKPSIGSGNLKMSLAARVETKIPDDSG